MAAEEKEGLLQESEDRFRALIEHAPDAIFIFDALDGRIIEANRAAERIFGCNKEQLLRKGTRPFYADVQPDGRPAAESIREHVQRAGSGEEVCFERAIHNAQGKDLLCQVKLVRLPARDQQLFYLSYVDITDQKRIEEQIRQSEERYRSVIEESDLGYYETDLEGNLTFVNDTLCRMLGYDRDSLLGLNYRTYIPPREIEGVRQIFNRVFRTGESIKWAPITNIRKDGTSRDFEDTISPLRNRGGAVIGFRGITRDMTERRQSEKALIASEGRFRSLFENMMDGYAYCRMIFEEDRPVDFIYLEVNKAFERLTGLKDVTGKKVTEAIPGIGDTNPELIEIYGRVSLTGRPERLEAYSEAFGGTLSVSVYSTEKNYFVAVFDNITERKKAEEEQKIAAGFLGLINESKNLEALIRGAVPFFQTTSGCEAVGIRLKEGEDYPYYEVRGFPQTFVRLENSLCARDEKGAMLRDGEGKPIIECMCGNVIGGRFDPAKSFFTREGSFWSGGTTALLATTSDQDRLARTRNRCNGFGYESVALIPLRYREDRLGLVQLNDHRKEMFTRRNMGFYERLAGYLAVAIARFQGEEEIRRLNLTLEQRVAERTAQLEALNRELESFSYSVSHDLQAPLRHLSGFANLLENQYRENLDGKGLHYLKVIFDSALQMSRLLNDLLSFSRMGRVEMRRSRVSMDILLKEVLGMVQLEWKDKEVVWIIKPLPGVYGDPELLRTVLTNLVLNALKFSRRKPEPLIEIGTLVDQPEEETFYIKDNGVGFDMAYCDELFGLFQRLHREEEFEGTGLGLANVKRIISRHGGRVWAEGVPGEGAAFYFSLPKQTDSQRS